MTPRFLNLRDGGMGLTGHAAPLAAALRRLGVAALVIAGFGLGPAHFHLEVVDGRGGRFNPLTILLARPDVAGSPTA